MMENTLWPNGGKGEVITITQKGSREWTGNVRVWDSEDYGLHGRREPYSQSFEGQWAVGDTLTSCKGGKCTGANAKCKWYGTAPICKGACKDGEILCAENYYGDNGHYCSIGSGNKKYCCKD